MFSPSTPQHDSNTDHWGAWHFGKNDAGFQFPSFRFAAGQPALFIEQKVLENYRIGELQPVPITALPILLAAIHQGHRNEITEHFQIGLGFLLL